MHCFIVKAHPLTGSLCGEMTRRVSETLENAGHSVDVADLYAEKFVAAMTVSERASYYAGAYATAAVAEHVARLQSAEGLVLLFPTWWFGPPAILKGWFDRVWAPGVAYDHSPGFGPIRPRLQRLRNALAVTTLGAAGWVDRLVLRQPVKRILKTAILGACAPQCRFQMRSLYRSEQLSSLQVERFWGRIRRLLERW